MVPFQRNSAIRRSCGQRRGKAELLTGYPRFSKGSAEQEEIPRSVRIDVRVCDVCVPSYGDKISYRILHTLTGQEGMHNIEVQFHQRAIDLLNDPQGSFRSVNGSP